MVHRLAIIPARGGSRRIPNKNIRSFCGRPMIAYILEAIRKSNLFSSVHVSTESRAVADVASNCGFPPSFFRPVELSGDHIPLMPVLRYVVEQMNIDGRSYDEVWMLSACAPLIDASDLIGAGRIYASCGSMRPVIPVVQYPVPVEWAFRRDSDGKLEPVNPGLFATRSQDLNPAFYDTGLFGVFPARKITESVGAGDDSEFIGYEIARHKAVDIDSEDDWQFAELIYRGVHGGAPDGV